MQGASQRGTAMRWPAAIAVLASVGIVAWFGAQQLGRGGLLPLERVRFEGELAHVSDSDLRAAVSPHVEGSWLGADVAAMRQAVEGLAWVEGAAVRRVWPDALHIAVTEHEPLARWRDTALISVDGTLFRPADRPLALPELSGPEGTLDEVLDAYRDWGDELAGAGLELVALRLDERRSWRGRLSSGTRLIIGRDDGSERVARLAAAWPELSRSAGAAERVDLRYPNGFAVRWRAAEGDNNEAPKGRTDES